MGVLQKIGGNSVSESSGIKFAVKEYSRKNCRSAGQAGETRGWSPPREPAYRWIYEQEGNMAKNLETSTVQVTCAPNPEDSSKVTITSVVPSTLELHIGDSATWQVSGLPSDHTVQLLFHLPGDNAPVGLFKSISTAPATGDGSSTVAVMGVIFSPPDAKQKDYPYDIEIRNSSGTVAVRHDPTIDNLGQPPGPDGGDDS